MNKKQRADKIIEVSKWMSKQGYDRKFTQGVSNVIVDYLDSHFSNVIPVDSDLSCDGCKWDGLQLGMRSPCDTCRRFHSHHKDLYVKNQ